MKQQDKVSEVNILFLMTVLASLAISMVVALLREAYHIVIPEFWSLLLVQGILILPTLIYVMKNRVDLKEFIRFHRIKISTIFWLIVFTFAITPGLQLINYVSMFFFRNVISGTVNGILDSGGLVVTLFCVAVVPAICEEAVYRGVFYNEYRKKNARVAIVLSGLLFGLLHMNFNQFIYAFIMGVVFTLVIEATDSILSTMIIHMTINGSSVLMAYLQKKMIDSVSGSGVLQTADTMFTMSQVMQKMLLPALLGIVIAVAIYRHLAISYGRLELIKGIFQRNTEPEESASSFLTFPLVIGICICLACMCQTL